jgi:phosphatidylethanolamine-binding protein (PEBP) family uncharacterized protein
MAAAASYGTITLYVGGNKETFTVLRVLPGSTNPLQVKSNRNGKQYVLKRSSSGVQEVNEYFAFKLYEAAGCRVPNTYLVIDAETETPCLLEEFIHGESLLYLLNLRLPEITAQLRTYTFRAIEHDLVIHALFANWDINEMGNTMIPYNSDGNLMYATPFIIDCGGTFASRAMGGVKPYEHTMKNIESIVGFANPHRPMSRFKGWWGIKRPELKQLVCNRWALVDQNAIYHAFNEVTWEVLGIFPDAGPYFHAIGTALYARMDYLNEAYCNPKPTASTGGAGAGASAASTHGGRRILRKTRKQPRSKRHSSHRRSKRHPSRRSRLRGGQQSPSLSVVYSPNLQVAGQQLTQQQTADAPTLTFSSLDPNQSYALLMHDPDAVKPSYIHWLITDITANETGTAVITAANEERTATLPYQGPSPPPDSAPVHRYLFTLFVQPPNFVVPTQRAGFKASTLPPAIARQQFTVESPASK